MTRDEEGADPRPRHTPIGAIGASAGGVGALRDLFRQLPTDLGLAYVVVVHLSPDHPSAMQEILAACTTMPVEEVRDAARLEPDRVYVISPDRELVIAGDDVTARPFTEPRGRRAPIDMFFRSIAAARGDGIALVLSGAGADGALGVRAVKEGGGVILVQEPTEAEFPMMPQNAIATGMADIVAPVARLAERIAEVARSKEAVRSIDPDEAADELRRIVMFLRARTGHDFSAYKRATVMRRVARRMQVRRINDLGAYAEHVREAPEEAQELFSDLLISVTMFFRDAAAFEALADDVIAPLMREDEDEEGVRAWVVGCATGEEAYSLAILMLEEMRRRGITRRVQIFASDLDEGALATAREGRYPRTIEADVSEERLERFFVDEGTHYRVRREVRDLVLFASHSVVREPPFLRLDLITCRNLLIYLERSLQTQLCRLFHYGLRARGALFLGSAETADVAPELFAPINREARLYRARPQAAATLPVLPQLPGDYPATAAETRRVRPGDGRRPVEAHVSTLEKATPPSVLVDEGYGIVHLSASVGRYILHPGGPFTGKLSDVVRPELRLDLKIALDRAFESREPSVTLPIVVAFDGARRRVVLQIVPTATDGGAATQALVFFLEGGLVPPAAEDDPPEEPGRPNATRRLHEELRAAQERLVASRGEHEAAIQDLRAANEELQSINEEYRSASEELETSKEELQSTNEELQAVNGELKSKLDSIARAHSDLQNLTAATEIGTLFLDPELRIRMFTPPVAELFNIAETDVGRLVTDFTHRLVHEGFEGDARRVLRHLAPVEGEVESRDGRWYMMRLRPYRTIEDRIDGVVVSFVDITARREAEARLRRSEESYRILFERMEEGFLLAEVIRDEAGAAADVLYHDANPAAAHLAGMALEGRRLSELEGEFEAHWRDVPDRVMRTGEPERAELHAAPLGRWYEIAVTKVADDRAAILFRDITARHEAEGERELLTRELSHRVKNTLTVVQALAELTGRTATTVEAFRERFLGRLRALGRSHGLLLETGWRSADLTQLVREALAPFAGAAGESVTLEGGPVALSPKQGLGLGLVLHELATNAAKYGALSARDGRLSISWRAEEDEEGRSEIRLDWIEVDGPTVEPPTATGFGTRMIEQTAAYELGGVAELTYPPEGVRCHVRFAIR